MPVEEGEVSMDKRQLRLALKEKLDHRRQLMQQNGALRADLGRERELNKFLLTTLGNPLVEMALEDCADHIMRAVVEHAVKASEVVADQTIEHGAYVIGISIPSLHIRHRLCREDVLPRVGGVSSAPIHHVAVDTTTETP